MFRRSAQVPRRSVFDIRRFPFLSPLLCALADLSPITSHRRPWSVVLWSESHPFGSHSSIGLEVRDFLKQAVFAEFIVQR